MEACNATLNPSLRSWVTTANLSGSDFPIQNLPFGRFRTNSNEPWRIGVAIGDMVLDLKAAELINHSDMNQLLAMKKEDRVALRIAISNGLKEDAPVNHSAFEQSLFKQSSVEIGMPCEVGDYTDFYSSKEHATNVGIMFRDPANALLPNWLWIPVGYHGRSSSVIISGQDIHRPKGQIKPDDNEPPIFAASRQVDFELEMGFITYDGKPLGDSISTNEAEEYIFGMCLFNDWSARDIQKWEYVPLGPFLAKNFASSISCWIVTMDALQPFAVDTPVQDPAVLSYLKFEGKKSYDIYLQVGLTPENSTEKIICNSNFKYMYWNMSQQLAHHTVNGCNVRCGDLMGSGTISGSTPDSFGSMLELAWKGTKPLAMNDGTERRFIQDGDTVTMRGFCQNDEVRIGFGEVKAKILPAK